MKDETSPEQMVVGDKSGIDLSESRPSLQALLKEHEAHLQALPDDCLPVDRARERAKLLTCIVEELSQILGLPNDSEKVYPSIFNDKSCNELLTRLDYLMLKMLYDRRVKAGMDRRQVMPVLRKIVNEYQQKNIVQTAELKVMEGGLYPLLY